MKFFEILTEAPLYPETSASLVSKAVAKDWQHIGGGLDAEVYGDPKDPKHVVKVLIGVKGRPADKASAGFLGLYRFAKEHPNHPNLPKFGKVTGHKLGKKPNLESVYFVPVERLYLLDLENNKQDKMFYEIAERRVHKIFNFNDTLKDFKEFYPKDFQNPTVAKQLIHKLKMFADIMIKCREYAKQHNLSMDIHPGNIMKRLDGTVVITDPYVTFD